MQKVAIITGGSRGIGKSTALEVARRGTSVILTYHTQREQGEAVAREINQAGGKAIALRLDTSDVRSFANFASEVSRRLKADWGREDFDYLVNNAGIGQRTLIKDVTETQFDELVNVNFKGPFFLTQRLLPLMADGGHIINLSSGLSRFTFPGTSVYGALKAALEGITRSLAKEYGARRIRANAVAPGAIDTEFGGGKGDEKARAHIAEATALGRLGKADDIGRFIAALLSDDSAYLNAQRIEVGGGIMI